MSIPGSGAGTISGSGVPSGSMCGLFQPGLIRVGIELGFLPGSHFIGSGTSTPGSVAGGTNGITFGSLPGSGIGPFPGSCGVISGSFAGSGPMPGG